MARFTWLAVLLGCFMFVGVVGCGGGEQEIKTVEDETETGTQVEQDLEKAGISKTEYARQMQQNR